MGFLLIFPTFSQTQSRSQRVSGRLAGPPGMGLQEEHGQRARPSGTLWMVEVVPPLNKLLSHMIHMEVSDNRRTPKSSSFIGFSTVNHPFWGTPIYGNHHLQYTLYISILH